MVARNILLNDFFTKLKEKYDVVIFSPLSDDQDFINKFKSSGVFFEKLIRHKMTKMENIFYALHKGLIYNPTVRLKTRYSVDFKNTQEENFKKLFKYYFQHIVFGMFLSKIRILREWLKKADALIYNKNYYQELLDRYKPVAVFITNISSDDEIYLLRAAKKNKILDFGMTKSWDNFSKVGFREKTNNLIVWNEYMRDEAIWFQCYKGKQIYILGVPQFDIYYDIKGKNTREEFAKTYDLDVNKKLILFGQEAPTASPDDPYVVEIIKNWIIKNNKDWQILVRPNFSYKKAASHFEHLIDNRIVFMDLQNKPSRFKDEWDLSYEHLWRLAMSMRFPDIVVTSTSTLALDALASDNKVICYSFDKDKNKPFGKSIKRLYGTMWFRDLRKYGLDEIIANDEYELINMIEAAIEGGEQKFNGRNKIIKRFCGPLDGKSGLRMFEFISEAKPPETKFLRSKVFIDGKIQKK
jgi:hypothetical protein